MLICHRGFQVLCVMNLTILRILAARQQTVINFIFVVGVLGNILLSLAPKRRSD